MGTLPWSLNDERQSKFYFSDSIMEETNVLMHHKDLKLNWKTIADLDKYKIGGSTGYFYGSEFDQAEKNNIIKVNYASTDLQNLKKLIHGRIQIFIIEKNVAADLMNREFSAEQRADFIVNPKPVNIRSLHLLLFPLLSYYLCSYSDRPLIEHKRHV